MGVFVVRISLLLLLGACQSWSAPQAPTPKVIGATAGFIQITRKDGWQVELQHAEIIGDSLTGVLVGAHPDRIAIPVAEIQSVAVRHMNARRTIVLGIGTIAVVSLVLLATAVAGALSGF
jgi:hypothetical protein